MSIPGPELPAAGPQAPGPPPKERAPAALRYLRKLRDLAELLRPYARPHKALLFSGIGASALLTFFRLAQPWPIKWIVDSISGKEGHHLPHFIPSGLAALSALYVALALGAAACEFLQQLLLAGLGNRVLAAFRAKLYAHVLSQPLAFHERRDMGELLTRVVYDTSRLKRGVNGMLIRTFQVVFMFAAVVAVLFYLHAGLAAAMGAFGALALFFMARSGGRILKAARRQRRREGQLAAVAAEGLQAIRELQAFGVSGASDGRFGTANARSLGREQKVRRLGALLTLRVEAALVAGVCLILWAGGGAVNSGALSLGSLVLFIHYAAGLSGPFRQFAAQSVQTGRTMACAGRLIKLMNREPAVSDLPGAAAAPPLDGALLFDGVSFKAPAGRRSGRKWILDGVTLDIKKGERVAVMGHNGSGKSTLLRLALRLADPHLGAVKADGRDLKEYTLESYRRQVSVMFQESVFLGATVRESIALGRPEATLDEIRDCARSCGLDAWLGKLENGYETPVHKLGALFSGGERQKIALARALLRGGRLWLLDEPAGHLDASSAAELTRALLEATKGRTTLWVTHDPGILPACDRVVLLAEGQVRYFGPPGGLGPVSGPAEVRPGGGV
jgi:ATP-binding cassette subfamily B protein